MYVYIHIERVRVIPESSFLKTDYGKGVYNISF